MSLRQVASATTIDVQGADAVEITGTTTVQTILGIQDGGSLWIYPTAALPLGATGNLTVITATCTAGRPILLLSRTSAAGVQKLVELNPAVIANSTAITVKDASFTIQDDGDPTKQLQFQLSGITTGTTRTLTAPNVSDTIAVVGTNNNFTIGQTVSLAQNAATIIGVTNTDGVNTGANARFDATNDITNISVIAHGSGRVATRAGVTLGNQGEIVANTNLAGLLIGALGAVPVVMYTNNAEALRIDSSQTILLKKTVSNYNGIATVKNGVPSEYAFVGLTAQGADIADTTFYTTPASAAFLYRVSGYIWDSTAGTGISTTTLQIKWTDPNGVAQAYALAALPLTSTAGFISFDLPIAVGNAAAIKYTTVAGVYAGGAKYDLRIVLEAL